MAQEGIEEEDFLREGTPAPDLATVKDIVRYYINAAKGRLDVRPTVSSTKNFAERLFGFIARVTKNACDPADRSNVFHVRFPALHVLSIINTTKQWIGNTLTADSLITNKRRPKHKFDRRDYDNLIVSQFTKDDNIFIHDYNRIQVIWAISVFCTAGSRIGALIPQCSEASERGIRWKVS